MTLCCVAALDCSRFSDQSGLLQMLREETIGVIEILCVCTILQLTKNSLKRGGWLL
jgi:hypothetical protein